MNNEEKIKEIVHEQPYAAQNDNYATMIEYGAIKMAEWKDNEMKKEKEELSRIVYWFRHIEQLANDRKTATGFVMSDADTLDEIKCLAANSVKYINKYVLDTNKL